MSVEILTAADANVGLLHGLPPLTEHEEEILVLEANGYTAPATAKFLNVSATSVDADLRRAHDKIGAVDRMDALGACMRLHLLY
jgi:DNA-binding CsgD family transcriptional regulator